MILVGLMYSCIKNRHWRYNQAAHLFCDKPENIGKLHELAQQIGLKRSWFQSDSVLPHYDLTVSKRKKAIAAGAVSVDRQLEVEHIRAWRRLKNAKI